MSQPIPTSFCCGTGGMKKAPLSLSDLLRRSTATATRCTSTGAGRGGTSTSVGGTMAGVPAAVSLPFASPPVLDPRKTVPWDLGPLTLAPHIYDVRGVFL